jgi:hypothetical protein
MLRSAVERKLSDEKIFWDGSEKHFTLNLNIMDYEMGNAFKRWLLPFYGSTILSIEGELLDRKGETVSKFSHKRSIVAGGFYTIGGCLKRRMTDKAPGFYVELSPWLENEKDIVKASTSKKIQLVPFEDKRQEKYRIGERQAAFNVSMGNIYSNRQIPDYIHEALRNELLATGNEIVGEEDEDIILTGEILKFWVWTETTPLYWDLKGEVEITLRTINPKNKETLMEKPYSFQSSTRTYVWPTEKLATEVIEVSIKGLMYKIRNDSIWLKES